MSKSIVEIGKEVDIMKSEIQQKVLDIANIVNKFQQENQLKVEFKVDFIKCGTINSKIEKYIPDEIGINVTIV